MGLLEKLKNTFFEEEIVEVEESPKKIKNDKGPKEKERRIKKEIVEEEKEEVVREVIKETPIKKEVSVKKETVVKKEPVKQPKEVVNALFDDDFDDVKEVFTEHSLTKPDTDFKCFDDDDFIDIEEPVKEKIKKEEEKSQQVYAGAKIYTQYGTGIDNVSKQPYSQPKEQRSGFKPTPIISPIYGILDQNYKKEEIVDRKEIRPNSSYVSRKNADLDSVRNKAFGELSQDLGLTSQEPIVIEEIRDEPVSIEDNLLYDMNEVNNTPAVDKVTIADAEEYFQDLGLEYNVDYKDAKYEKASGRRVNSTPPLDDIEEDDYSYEKPPVSKVNTDDDEESGSLEDNLFDLIDSMYEEKE